ncbi:MAG: hypothetical protein LBB79_07180 [Prevotellaceae bacterium]|nr:hypothetical protein [Prevotellaceae bacterium]
MKNLPFRQQIWDGLTVSAGRCPAVMKNLPCRQQIWGKFTAPQVADLRL